MKIGLTDGTLLTSTQYKIIQRINVLYEKARARGHTQKPLAWALYQVWKEELNRKGGSMTREQAINYLRSSGMNEQQIDSVVAAFDQTREGDYMMKKVEQIIFHKLLRVMAMGPIIAKSDMEKLAHDAVEEIREEFRKAGVDVWPRWEGGEK